MVTTDRTAFKPVSKSRPCEICEGDHKCSRGEDGLIQCGRKSGPVPGYVYMGQAKGDSQFALYRREDDPHLQNGRQPRRDRARNPATPSGNGKQSNGDGAGRPSIVRDWPKYAEALARGLTPERRGELARALSLPEAVLCHLTIGTGDDGQGEYWTFPEVDGTGEVCGLVRRYVGGDKKAMAGAKRGIIAPKGWEERSGPGWPIFCPEGPSDTLALTALGLAALGRPNNTGGTEQLAQLLRAKLPPAPKGIARANVVILGEYDPKPDGTWPGRDGAVKVARELSERLGDEFIVRWLLPPRGFKDVREWVKSRKLDPGCMDAWHDAGEKYLREMQDCYLKVDPAEGAAQSFRWAPINSTAFAEGNYRPQWLVQRTLVRGQPGVIGGPRKALKTTLLVDLAISLASATRFLGQFEVYHAARVALLSGESGEFTLQETALRICKARGLDLAGIGDRLLWQFRLPQLAVADQLAALRDGLAEDKVEVLIFDPLYLALLAGQGPNQIKAENLFDVGPLLLNITTACLEVGCTPLLAHHSRKETARSRDPLELDDLAYAGIAEFARQWVLLSRREKYEPGTGEHHLWLNIGGSTGHGGLWSVDVAEGVVDENFAGRTWDVSVTAATEARKTARNEKEEAKTRQKEEQDKSDEGGVLAALDRLDPKRKGVSYNQVRAEARLSADRMTRAVTRLLAARLIRQLQVNAPIGSGATRAAKGLARVKQE